MKYLKALWQFCAYLFVPQLGRHRRKMELLKKDITYLIGKELAEGNLDLWNERQNGYPSAQVNPKELQFDTAGWSKKIIEI